MATGLNNLLSGLLAARLAYHNLLNYRIGNHWPHNHASGLSLELLATNLHNLLAGYNLLALHLH